MKSGFKSLVWLVLILVFGLLQVWTLIAYDKAIISFSLDFKQLIIDGVFLFFSSAIVTSIALDYFFDKNVVFSKEMSGAMFSLFPLFIVGLTLLLYLSIHTTPAQDIDYSFISFSNKVIITMSVMYCFITKTILFLNEEKS